jgi:5-methylcytosine-specific restriction endonuclease McrA
MFPEKTRAAIAAWQRNNPERYRMISKRHRVRRLGIKAELTVDQWLSAIEVFDSRCAYCLRKLDVCETDHVVAISRGGTDNQDNVVPACGPCNVKKGTRPVWHMVNTPTRF